MGVVALTSGGVASIVLIVTFFMEMCCSVAGLQYGLGIMYLVAAAAQGLTFLVLGDDACNEYSCTTSSSSIWSIVATSLYFIAMVQSFAAPFPKEKICGRAACCACCKKKEGEVAGKSAAEGDVEAQEAAPTAPTADDDAAAAAAAGVAAGAGAAAVVSVAADDEEEKEDKMADEEKVDGYGSATSTGVPVEMSVLNEDINALDQEEEAAAAAAAASESTAGSAAEGGGAVSEDADVFKSATSMMVGDAAKLE